MRTFFLFLSYLTVFYCVDVRSDGEWYEASRHTQYEDADRQVGMFVERGAKESDYRIREYDEPGVEATPIPNPPEGRRKNRPVHKNLKPVPKQPE